MDNDFFGFMINELERKGDNPWPIFGNDETQDEDEQDEEEENPFLW